MMAGGLPVWGLSDAAQPRFNREIRPILAENCLSCHGPDAGKRKATLRLDLEDAAKAKVIVPGKPDESTLIQRVFASTESERMPPPDSDKRLNDAQKVLLRQWIAVGAPWEAHWAYVPESHPQPPEVVDGAWPRHAIDPFILARLERERLHPSLEADRRTLIRRLSFDLTGLPPAPAEVDAFLYDNRADAWERQVDRLLASPHFGERLAVWWLDLARYADSVGYHGDQRLTACPYRRGLYTHWQRTFPHPALLVFDAPSREECTVARTVSNTPLQALVLLNDPEYVEAARVLAERIIRQPGDFELRLAFAFARVLGRVPGSEEAMALRNLFQEQRDNYDKDPESAMSLVSVGGAPVAGNLEVADLAAWTSVSRTLLNLHETITRN